MENFQERTTKAEESMNEVQKRMSFRRSEALASLREIGKSGHLYSENDSSDPEGYGPKIYGEIDGIQLELYKESVSEEKGMKYTYSGKINGETIGAEDAEKLWDKYKKATINKRGEDDDVAKVSSEYKLQSKVDSLLD